MHQGDSRYPLLRLDVQSCTWVRESRGLFDFESNHVVRSQASIRGSALLVLRENRCVVVQGLAKELPGQARLLAVTPRGGMSR